MKSASTKALMQTIAQRQGETHFFPELENIHESAVNYGENGVSGNYKCSI